jgi:phosphatidylserine/phosphatidylglycerophosphate/cardiolipin synthase-like enzyme
MTSAVSGQRLAIRRSAIIVLMAILTTEMILVSARWDDNRITMEINSEYQVFINEVYPNPDIDINSDGEITQIDEFIEIFNSDPQDIDLSGYTISDNTGTYHLTNCMIEGRGHLLLGRWETGLVLGRDEELTLKNSTGHVMDHYMFQNAGKGDCFQRSPDGDERWIKGGSPTPGSENCEPPSFIINEVLADPEGANSGKQWIEILNRGPDWNVDGFIITNHDSMTYELPSIEIGKGERFLIIIGPSSYSPKVPENTTVVHTGSISPLYSSGDDLELIDSDGYSLDFVAYGNSTHVDKATGSGQGGSWKGKYYDSMNSSMSLEGDENLPSPAATSIMRYPDGYDTDSPDDLENGPELTGGTPGWNNSRDLSLEFELPDILEIREGDSMTVPFNISSRGSMNGNITFSIQLSDGNWTAEIPQAVHIKSGVEEEIAIKIGAPDDLRISNGCILDIEVSWMEFPFMVFRKKMEIRIPSFDGGLSEIKVMLDGFPSNEFPEGSFIEVEGKIDCYGEVAGGNSTMVLELYEPKSTTPLLSKEIEFKNLKSTSTRKFDQKLDTLGLGGNYTLKMMFDPTDLIRESNENNNQWSTPIEILETTTPEDMKNLLITGVVWNSSEDENFVTIRNQGSMDVELSDIRIVYDDTWISFPDDMNIEASESIAVAWGGGADGSIIGNLSVFRADGKGPYQYRMEKGEGSSKLKDGETIELVTKFRDHIDEVPLKRRTVDEKYRSSFPETTWGTMLKRRSSQNGSHIDTDSPLDWYVDPVSAWITTLLIDPGTNGPGEIIGITPASKEENLAGIGLFRSGEMMVIPPNTVQTQSEIIISKQPEDFQEYQKFLPDLSFDSDWEGIPSCDVPGYGSPVLPNNGGELILVDRGSRILDKVQWGDDTILDPARDHIISRPMLNGSPRSWRLKGPGYLPSFPRWSNSDETTFCSGNGILPLIANESETGDVTVIIPGLTSVSISEDILGLREKGWTVRLYVTEPPWDRDEYRHHFLPEETELSLYKEFERKGIRTFSPERSMKSWMGVTILTDSSILTCYPSSKVDSDFPLWNCIDNEELAEEFRNLVERILEEADWFEISPLLDKISTSDFGDVDNQRRISHIRRNISTKICWGIDPFDFLEPGDDIEIIHSSGPVDTTNILELLEGGSSIRFILSNSLLRVRNSESILHGELEMKKLIDRYHKLSDLDKDTMTGIWALKEISEGEGYDLDFLILDAEESNPSGLNFWKWKNGNAFNVQIGIPNDFHCWLINTFNEGEPKLPDFMEEDSSFSDFPDCLLPMKEENDFNESSKVLIDRIYYDTYLKDDPDEAICIMNCDREEIDLTGFFITDDEGTNRNSDGLAIIPENTWIEPGEKLWIARDGGRFEFQFGFKPDLALTNISPERSIPIAYGDLRLANSNDTVCIRDPDGKVVDVLPYGGSKWESIWQSYSGGDWIGPPAPSSGWGKLIYRWTEWGNPFPLDTNQADDFLTYRPAYPGQSNLDDMVKGIEGTIKTGVCPDSGWKILRDTIEGSGSTIFVNVYQMTSEWIVSSLIGARERGVEVKVILEGGPVGGTSYSSEILADRLTRSGIEVRWICNRIEEDIRDRYRYNHAKYIIVDGGITLVSTDNFKDSSFPRNGQILEDSTRGWIVSVDSVELAMEMEKIFFEDWEGHDMITNQVENEIENLENEIPFPGSHQNPFPVFPVMDVNDPAQFRILASPDHVSKPGNELIDSILGARRTIDLQLMDIDTDFNLGNGYIGLNLKDRWGVREPVPGFNNPYLAALFDSASNGVKVRLLLDGSDFNGDGKPENLDTANKILEAIDQMNLSNTFRVRLHPDSGIEEYSSISLIHTKGMIIDNEKTWISSFNWGPTSALENREMGLLIESKEVSHYFSEVMDHDWSATLHDDIITEIRMVTFFENGKGGINFDFRMRTRWSGDEKIDLFLISENGREESGLISRLDPGFEGEVRGSILLKNISRGDEIRIVARTSDREIVIHELTINFEKELFEDDNFRFLKSSFTPVFLIIGITLSISVTGLVLKEIRRKYSIHLMQEE